MGETCSACNPKKEPLQQELVTTKADAFPPQVEIKEEANLQEQLNESRKPQDKPSKIASIKSKMGESRGYNYKKLDNGGVDLKEIPDFSNEITAKKK